MAVAVLVPLTFAMEPSSALILMGAYYTGAIYGGAYPAVLLNTPGTPSAIATTFDGYPMAKRGDGALGRAHVWTPVNNAHLVCRRQLDKNHSSTTHTMPSWST